MDGHPECLAYGAIISFVVSLLKGIPVVKQYPKLVVAALSIAAVLVVAFMGDQAGQQWATIARCVAETFATAVATHETVVQPVKKMTTADPLNPDQ